MHQPKEKAALRISMLKALKQIPERRERSLQLLDALVDGGYLSKVKTVCLFIPLEGEVDVRLVAEYCWQRNVQVVVPEAHHFQQGKRITFRTWIADDPLLKTQLGVYHPRGGMMIEPQCVDLVIVPGLAFTPDGYRLGRGMGFYDRLLTQNTLVSIGVCFQEQLLDSVPHEEHDKPVDVVLSC